MRIHRIVKGRRINIVIKSKRTILIRHSKRRAASRYGLNLNDDDIKAISGMIRRKEGKCLKVESLRVSQWEVEYRGNILRVVYDKKRKTTVTFLPPIEPSH